MFIGNIQSGDHTEYGLVDFGSTSPTNIELVTASRTDGNEVAVYLDNITTNNLVATVPITNTGSWYEFTTESLSLSESITGTHKVILVYATGGVNVDSFKFTDGSCYTSTIDAFSTIEAEDYCYGYGVQEYTNENVVFIGNIQSSDYTEYGLVDFGSSSPTHIELVTASRTDGNEVAVYLDNITTNNLVATVPITNTSSWYEFTTEYVSLSESITGTHKVILVYTTGGVNVDSFKFSDGSCYSSTIDAFSTIEAEDYCYGYGVQEYTDVDTVFIGHIQTGDYTEYGLVDFGSTSPTYIELVTASATDSNEVAVYIDNVTSNNLLATVPVTNTGSWTVFSTEYLALSETITGTHKVILTFPSGGVNVDSFKFSDGSCYNSTVSAYSTIEAEDYCFGYGVVELVDGDVTYLGYIHTDDYTEYGLVNFTNTSPAYIELVSASLSSGNEVEVYLDNVTTNNLVATVPITNTGSWYEYSTNYVALSEDITGTHKVILMYSTGGINMDSFSFSDGTCVNQSLVATDTIEAEDYCEGQGVGVFGGGTRIGSIYDSNWVKYGNVDFGSSSIDGIEISAGRNHDTNTYVDVYLDSMSSSSIATVTFTNTGGYSSFASHYAELSSVITGIHDVYLVFSSDDTSVAVADLDNLTFGSYETLSTSNFKFNDLGLRVYPNPVVDYLHISSEVESIIVRDLMGRALIEVEENTNVIDVSSLASGVYFVEISLNSQTQILKFIKN